MTTMSDTDRHEAERQEKVALATEGIRKFCVERTAHDAVMAGLNAANAYNAHWGHGWPGVNAEKFARDVASAAVEAYRQSLTQTQEGETP
jgi:hypothetical protein